MMNTLFCLFPLLSSLLVASTHALSQNSFPDWKFLPDDDDAGDRTGVFHEAGKGWFRLNADTGGGILLRRNHAEYPAAGGRPVFSDDDLMIIYRDNGSNASNDVNGNRVSRYDVTFSPEKKEIIVLGQKDAAGRQYRLTYEDLKSGAVKVLFEIAPANKPGKFAKYIEATVHRE